MKGFTLIELLLAISFIEPLQTGLMEGSRSGIIGAAIGLLVGLVIAILWAMVFSSWVRRNSERLKTSKTTVRIFVFATLIMLFALPVMSWIITHQLIAPFHR